MFFKLKVTVETMSSTFRFRSNRSSNETQLNMKLSFLNCFRPPVVTEEVGKVSKETREKGEKDVLGKVYLSEKKERKKM